MPWPMVPLAIICATEVEPGLLSGGNPGFRGLLILPRPRLMLFCMASNSAKEGVFGLLRRGKPWAPFVDLKIGLTLACLVNVGCCVTGNCLEPLEAYVTVVEAAQLLLMFILV